MNGRYIKIIVFQSLFTIIIFITLLHFFTQFESAKLERQVENRGQTLAFSVQQRINVTQGVLASLAYNYDVDTMITKEKFDVLASYFIKQNPSILYIQHKNEDTVTDMVYPSTYEYTLGATLKGRKEVEEAVSKAIEKKIITANTPFVLKNTDNLLGLVIRYPLYKNDMFSGFFVVVINVEDYIDNIIADQSLEDYNISFYDEHEVLFWGSDIDHKNATYDIDIPIMDNYWTLRVSLKNGFASATAISMIGLSVAFIVIVYLLVYMQIGFFKKDNNIKYLANLKQELEKVKESYSLALESANDALWEWNMKTGEIVTSDKWMDITGNELNGQGIDAILQKDTILSEDYESVLHELEACIKGQKFKFRSDYRIIDVLGNISWVQIKGRMYMDSQERPTILAGSISNIDERKQRESKIEYMAYYDQLTGLPNKFLFMEALELELSKIEREKIDSSILMLDLDNFKQHNDSLGLEFCDQLLKHIGEQIAFIAGNENITARFGGDEFLLLVRNTQSRENLVVICNKMLDLFSKPFVLDFKNVHITASIGIVCCLDSKYSASDIIRNADTALNKAKDSGKNQYCFYDANMHDEILRRSEIETGLRDAIRLDTLGVHYQLQQNLNDGSIRGIEALARLNLELLGNVSPIEFITIAEYTGLIIPLGNWILRSACKQGKTWIDSGMDIGKISVNISANQLFRNDFLKDVIEILNDTGFPVASLELEITESILINATPENLEMLKKLKSLGLSIALDDFGTGYSSLKYLTILPIDTLKIDKAFVDKAIETEMEHHVINTIIKLAHTMNLHVVAEGVETEAQKVMLINLNCDSIQGYYFAKPMPAAEIEKMIGGDDVRD